MLRDLQWLFSASALPQEGQATFSLEDYPDALRSVINFGTRHLFGLMSPSMRDLERQLAQALYTFEPRILRNSLRSARESRALCRARRRMRALGQSAAEHLHIKTRLDIESGHCTVGD